MLNTSLLEHIEVHADYYQNYELYQPDRALLEAVAAHQPRAHVLVVHRVTCKDCIRNVPAMTRIAEHLPGWTWEILENADAERQAVLGVSFVPTFVVYDQVGGNEIGRIVENPLHGSLEADLLNLVSRRG